MLIKFLVFCLMSAVSMRISSRVVSIGPEGRCWARTSSRSSLHQPANHANIANLFSLQNFNRTCRMHAVAYAFENPDCAVSCTLQSLTPRYA